MPGKRLTVSRAGKIKGEQCRISEPEAQLSSKEVTWGPELETFKKREKYD